MGGGGVGREEGGGVGREKKGQKEQLGGSNYQYSHQLSFQH